jgi:hypothetical protein
MFPIVEKLGGWPTVDKLLQAREITTEPEAKKQWRKRGLPWQVRFVLALAARRKNIQFTEDDFLLHKPVDASASGEAA